MSDGNGDKMPPWDRPRQIPAALLADRQWAELPRLQVVAQLAQEGFHVTDQSAGDCDQAPPGGGIMALPPQTPWPTTMTECGAVLAVAEPVLDSADPRMPPHLLPAAYPGHQTGVCSLG
jgi:hypothetical protein